MPGPISAKALPLGIPNTLVPIADRDGQCTQPWRYFFGSIGSGGPPGPPGPAGPAGPAGRQLLASSIVYYVRTDGSNSNTGLVNSAGGAFLTPQKAWDTIIKLDLNGQQAVIQFGKPGTYPGIASQGDYLVGGGSIPIIGFSSTPSDTLIQTTNTDCFGFNLSRISVRISNLKMTTAGSGNCIFGAGAGVAIQTENVDFGSCAGAHMNFSHNTDMGSGVSYNVSGGAQFHILCATQAIAALHGSIVNFTNNPNFSIATAFAELAGQIFVANMTFNNGNTVTGAKFSVGTQAIIATSTGDVNYIPGNSPGFIDASTYGVYT